MPYIPKEQRAILDPLIGQVARFVKSNWQPEKEIDYLRWMKYILCDLVSKLRRLSIGPVFNPFPCPIELILTNDLENLLYELAGKIRKLAGTCGNAENLAGLLNYACTQILFLMMPAKRYWALNATRSACVRVALALANNSGNDDTEVDLFVGVLLCDIPDECYRRIMAECADDEMRENGDIGGYARFWSVDTLR